MCTTRRALHGVLDMVRTASVQRLRATMAMCMAKQAVSHLPRNGPTSVQIHKVHSQKLLAGIKEVCQGGDVGDTSQAWQQAITKLNNGLRLLFDVAAAPPGKD